MQENGFEKNPHSVSWINRIKTMSQNLRDAGDMMRHWEERLYESSVPVAEDHPSQLIPIARELGAKGNLTHLPELRGSALLAPAAVTLPSKNSVVYGEMFGLSLPPNTLRGLSAHEIGHVVFGDKGQSVVKTEARADRFAHFLAGDCSGFIDFLKQQDEYRKLETSILKNAGLNGKFAALMKERNYRKSYGSLEQRIEHLTRPLMSYEIKDFTQAIAEYNSRMAKGVIGQISSHLVR